MISVYHHAIGHLVIAAYSAWYGDPEANYGRFIQVSTIVEITVSTLTATLLSLWLFNKLAQRTTSWKLLAVTSLAWEVAAIAVLIWAIQIGFAYEIHQLDWKLFGPSDDLYSFRNLFLPRIIAWLVSTTPVAVITLWAYSKFSKRNRTERHVT